MDELNLREVIKQLSSRPIAYHRIFSVITGSLTAGVLLSQIAYWYTAMKGKEFYKTDKNFADETGMSLCEMRTAKNLLKSLKLIQTVAKGLPAKTYYQLNEDVLVEFMTTALTCGEDQFRKDTSSAGYIYLARSAITTKLTKIGRTKDIDRRKEELEKDIPDIEIIYTISSGNTVRDEKNIHKIFEDKRVKGEWFALSNEDIQSIKNIQMTAIKFKSITNTSSSDSDSKSKSITNTGISDSDKHSITEINTETKTESRKKTSTQQDKTYSKESESYMIASYLLNRIIANYPNYRKKEHTTETLIEKKIQGWATAVDYMIRLDDRSISEIMAVIDWSQDDPFWKQNIKSTWKLREKFDDLEIRMVDEQGEITPILEEKEIVAQDLEKSSNKDLIKKIIKAYAFLINNKNYYPSHVEMLKFIKTAEKMLEFYEDRSIINTNWIKYLEKCLKKNYTERGETLYPGHLCSDHFWNVLLPQFVAELGV